MKLIGIFTALCALSVISGCTALQQIDYYTAGAEPYRALTDDDVHSSECRITFGDEVTVCGQGAWLTGREIQISEGGVYIITGSCDDSSINIKTDDAVKLVFNSADITNPNGCVVTSSSDRLVIACDSGSSTLTGSGGEYDTAVCSDGLVLFSGSGSLTLDGGVFSADTIRFAPSVSTFCEIYGTNPGELIKGVLNINR